MKATTEIPLGSIGYDFLGDVLSDHTSVSDLIRKAALSGNFFAVLPEDAGIPTRQDLHEGGEDRELSIVEYFCRSVEEYHGFNPEKFSAFAFDSTARPADLHPEAQHRVLQTFAGVDVLYRLSLSDQGICGIHSSLAKRECISFYVIFMLFSGDQCHIEELIGANNEKAGDHLEMFAINAFDQDGVIIWRRGS